MRTLLTRVLRRSRRAAKHAGLAVAGGLAVAMLNGLRLMNPDRTADIAAWLMRTIGPLFKENRIGRENLTAAFPEKSAAEIDTILRGVWDNLGRMGVEFAHIDRLWDFDENDQNPNRRVSIPPDSVARFYQLAQDGKPALVFASHLANWELPAICAATYKLDSAVLYRGQGVPAIDRWLRKTREASMGTMIPTSLEAPLKIAEALERGAHVGMLVDQYFDRGVEVTFFGRKTLANPLLAWLAQRYKCPIHGTHIVRLPNHHFRAELTEEIKPARDANGEIDVAGTTQIIMSTIEGWIREHPEQWLWLHRRWRPNAMRPLRGRFSASSRGG